MCNRSSSPPDGHGTWLPRCSCSAAKQPAPNNRSPRYPAQETLRLLKGRLPNTISLREWITGATHPVLADLTQIHQICVKLLAHAEGAMNATGGVLEVRLDNVDLSHVIDGQELPSAWVNMCASPSRIPAMMWAQWTNSCKLGLSLRIFREEPRRGELGQRNRWSANREGRFVPPVRSGKAPPLSLPAGNHSPNTAVAAEPQRDRASSPSRNRGNFLPSETKSDRVTVPEIRPLTPHRLCRQPPHTDDTISPKRTLRGTICHRF